jgi:actin-related protein 7, plant
MATDADKLGKTVVVDYGSDTIKAGRARDVPSEGALSCVIPSAVEARAPGAEGLARPPGGGSWPRPRVVRRGRVADAEQLEALLHHALYDRLRWRYGRQECLVVVEPVLASRAEREAIVQVAFEALGVRGFFVADAAACSLFACNKQAGLSVDIGHGKALVASVAEGTTHVAGAAALPWAGEDLDGYTRRLLAGRGGPAAAAAAQLPPEQLRALKEQIACAAASAEDFEAAASGDPARAAAADAASARAAADKQQQAAMAAHQDAWRRARRTFALPDGTTLELRGDEGYRLGEALVRPESAGLAAPPLGEVCCDVVAAQMEAGARRAIWENILVWGGCGGGVPGLRERLIEELPLYGPASASFGAAAVPHYMPPVARRHAAWVGGAVLSRVAMHQMITANEYDEYGPAVVARIVG